MSLKAGYVSRLEETVEVLTTEFAIITESSSELSLEAKLEPLTIQDSFLLELRLSSEQPCQLVSLSISWQTPVVDMAGLYLCGNPGDELSRLPFWNYQKESCANRGVPFLALINRRQENRFAVGLLDQLTETSFQANLSELTRSYHCTIQKPASQSVLNIDNVWTEQLFISKAPIAWPEVLASYRQQVDSVRKTSFMPVPKAAYDPVFCTWTAIHHDVSHDWIMRNARVAADLGFKTWLTDDGWFLDQGQFGNYRLVGDWQASDKKFPEFKSHVKTVQALGFKYLLWVAPFMIGDDNALSQRFQKLLTTGQSREAFKNLSPRQPETQKYVFDLLSRLVSDYELDGLKIDFLDAIPARAVHVQGEADGSFGENFFNTLKLTVDGLLKENPNLLIEFRNSYTNLASRAYANLYRSSDVPINPTLNRWQAVMLRLLAPGRAIHLDPALWHPGETDEAVAVHLINCLVGVPMVSIELDNYPQSHLELIRYWIGFYNSHRQTLAHARFSPVLRHGYIPAVFFEGKEETIIAVYDEVGIDMQGAKRVWLLNGSSNDAIQLSNPGGRYTCIYRDKFGAVTKSDEGDLKALMIEIGGSVELTKVT